MAEGIPSQCDGSLEQIAILEKLEALESEQAEAVIAQYRQKQGLSGTERGPPAGALNTELESSKSFSPLPIVGRSESVGNFLSCAHVRCVGELPALIYACIRNPPKPIFHDRRNEDARKEAALHSFPLRVVFDEVTAGLEAEQATPKFKGGALWWGGSPLMGQLLAGRYKVQRYLGGGQYSCAVQCVDTCAAIGAPRFVCVKITKAALKGGEKDTMDQNLWEVKLLTLLEERTRETADAMHLPKILDVFYYREVLFVVYELFRDNLLHIYKYIQEKNMTHYFTVSRCREVSRQILSTLAVLERHGVIHNDLKPENIVISSLSACKVFVIDYGNACLMRDERCSYAQSRGYRAPEVVLGAKYTTKVDIWSLGCVIMELCTGKKLFAANSVKALESIVKSGEAGGSTARLHPYRLILPRLGLLSCSTPTLSRGEHESPYCHREAG